MNHPEKSTKRIVSKAEYVALQSKKASRLLSGRLLILVAWTGMIITFVGFLAFMVTMGVHDLFPPFIRGGIFLLTGAFGWFFCRFLMFCQETGRNQVDDAKAMEEVLPFTHTNTSNLTVSESLVRASSEPLQEQESVLLRASIYSQQTPSDQLLRSVE